MRPVIGITSYIEKARWLVWENDVALAPMTYVEKVRDAGGRPVLLPPQADAVAETLDALDGIVFTGGSDVGPERYGADPHPETKNVRTWRDEAELALLEGALERDLPTLAICRGMQLLNVVRGGDLHQHLPDLVGHEGHRAIPDVYGAHPVRLDPATRTGALLGTHADIRSHHHQAADRIGDGLVPFAWAEDGTVEGLEDPALRFAVGVQWPPEAGEDMRLFEALVAEAAAYRAGRAA
jgi:gamma-glutamyl-gamma-aminobutyrate hydrolase PuuD